MIPFASLFRPLALAATLALPAASLAGQEAPPEIYVGPRPTRTGIDAMSGAYGGWVQFRHEIHGPYGFSIEAATVFVKAGKAQCTGTRRGESETVSITGNGLFHVTFKSWSAIIDDALPPDAADRQMSAHDLRVYRDSLRRAHRPEDQAYAFWVACPNPPNDASDAHPFDTYDQDGGPRWDARTQTLILPDTLRGSWDIPAPETDNLNGVSGALRMAWFLCIGCEVRINTRSTRPPAR